MAGKWIMFDLETLGLERDSVIVSIGACRFDVDGEPTDTMALLLDMEEQVTAGRKLNLGTVLWWMQQDSGARDWNFNRHNRYPVDVALRAFLTFCQGASLYWCRGTNFDCELLEHLLVSHGLKAPWRYNQVRDVRTLDELADPDLDFSGLVGHKPLDDCLMQVKQVQNVFKRFEEPVHSGLNLRIDVPNAEAFRKDQGTVTGRLVPRRSEDE